MDVISVFYHPTGGMFGRTDQTIEETQRQAIKFAAEHYPNTPTIDPWTLAGWWLLKDDGLPFSHPKPWPIAFALKKSTAPEAVLGRIPKYIILLSFDQSQFTFCKAATLNRAEKEIRRLTANQVRLVESQYGGLIGTRTGNNRQEHVVAHVIAL